MYRYVPVRQQFREIFLQLGFAEMPTNNFVESGFWNFDTLIQPQMHPVGGCTSSIQLTHSSNEMAGFVSGTSRTACV